MKKKYFVLLLPVLAVILSIYQCHKDALKPLPQPKDTLSLTQVEKDSILKGDTNKVMRILTIFNYDDSLILRTKSHEVRADPKDTVLYRLARRMYYTLKATGSGVGLAAVQVGILRDMIWVKRLDKTGQPFECFLNARISLYSSQAVIFNGDGCLSIPGKSGNTHRFASVLIDYDKLDGTHHQEIIEGYSSSSFTAIIFQHEIDHLHAILYIDRINAKDRELMKQTEQPANAPYLM
jgi:peptide deformylase